MSLRIGVIGAGSITLDHTKVAVSLGHQIVAGCTRSIDSRNWGIFLNNNPNAKFSPLPDLLVREDIDAYFVGLSWYAMPEWLPKLLINPKPMLLEKPIGINSRDIKNAINGNSNFLHNKIVGFNRRFYEPVADLKKRLSKGGLVSARISISENLDNLVKRWGLDILPYILSYSSCHILDLSQYLLGPLNVRSRISRPVKNYAPYSDIQAFLSTQDGCGVQLSIKQNDPIVVGIHCHFDDDTLWHLAPIEQLSVYQGYDIQEMTTEIPIKKYWPKRIKVSYANSNFRPGFMEEIKSFLENPTNCEPAARIKDSLSLQRLIESLQGTTQ
jgi:predicted dehydrogenase